ncbi:MAG: ParB/RepB/Spo0J family partition protein [Dysgonamonadaceae bacterium]|jgi:ParB family chromosome partitioning protein|nr:ParB/RepB/Spo0J family partition protein [Dysgonamonadaceae bacterium]
MAKQNRSALGRGLDALITMDDVRTNGTSSISEIELSKINPNPDQPRSVFEQEALEELAASIKTHGIIQPITLREIALDKYQIISGERRYRASLMAGLTALPAYIKKASDENVMEMALIENIQREDLNSIEIALSFQNLIESYNLTQDMLSERVGKKRATISNFLRLLKLPAEIQLGLTGKTIDMGHAKVLLSLDDPTEQKRVYEQIISEGHSVRRTEEIVREIKEGGRKDDDKKETPKKTKPVTTSKTPEEYAMLQEHLTNFFNAKIGFSCDDKGKGKIIIPFDSDQDLERIMKLLDTLEK